MQVVFSMDRSTITLGDGSCNCSLGISVNFDAVLQFVYYFLCGFVVFGASLRPPLSYVKVIMILHKNESGYEPLKLDGK